MPSVHIPDRLVFEIIKLGKDHKKYIREAVYEKLERDGVKMENKLEASDDEK